MYVTNLKDCDGKGYSAEAHGVFLLVGSYEFMKSMRVYVPENMTLDYAVYTAINSDLAGIFAVNYNVSRATADSLHILNDHKSFTPLIAVKDFNVTEDMIRSRFIISTKLMEFPSDEEKAQLTDESRAFELPPAAIICRDGIVPFADTLMGACRLKKRSRLSALLSVISAVLGLILILFFILTGKIEVASAANILLYSLLWAVPSLLISGGINKF